MSVRRFPPYIELGPERTFGVQRVTGDAAGANGVMTTGSWNRDRTGAPSAGSMGVLLDDVLGFGVAVCTPAGWSTVTTHIHAEFLGPFSVDGSVLTAKTDFLDMFAGGGMSTGALRDDAGRVVARASLRGSFIESSPGGGQADRRAAGVTGAADVVAALGGSIEQVHDGADLTLTVGADDVNIRDTLHGGVTLCAAETAANAGCGGADGMAFATTGVDITYLRPAPFGHRVRFRARPVHAGRRMRVIAVDAIGENGKPIALATVSMHSLPDGVVR